MNPRRRLATELPVAVLARLLGIHINVAVQWQQHSAGDWTNYAADLNRRPDRLCEEFRHVENECRVHPARVGADVGQVRDPQGVRGVGGELPFDPVRRPRSPRFLPASGLTCLQERYPLQISIFHQSFHSAASRIYTLRA